MFGDEQVTYANAPEKLQQLGAALGIDTWTQGMIRRQELQAAQDAANAAASGRRPATGLNIPG